MRHCLDPSRALVARKTDQNGQVNSATTAGAHCMNREGTPVLSAGLGGFGRHTSAR
jgi:hypothetical protein